MVIIKHTSQVFPIIKPLTNSSGCPLTPLLNFPPLPSHTCRMIYTYSQVTSPHFLMKCLKRACVFTIYWTCTYKNFSHLSVTHLRPPQPQVGSLSEHVRLSPSPFLPMASQLQGCADSPPGLSLSESLLSLFLPLTQLHRPRHGGWKRDCLCLLSFHRDPIYLHGFNYLQRFTESSASNAHLSAALGPQVLQPVSLFHYDPQTLPSLQFLYFCLWQVLFYNYELKGSRNITILIFKSN